MVAAALRKDINRGGSWVSTSQPKVLHKCWPWLDVTNKSEFSHGRNHIAQVGNFVSKNAVVTLQLKEGLDPAMR